MNTININGVVRTKNSSWFSCWWDCLVGSQPLIKTCKPNLTVNLYVVTVNLYV